ncbi:MAG TPA: DUF5985 family protein [Croceibacterium sp.]|nr:DUF5985 family protein [Croceibacterium sp.]
MTLLDFLSGAITMGFLVCGLFFWRFWSRTRDSLFLWFAVAFWLLSIGQALLALTGIPVEERSWLYLIRLAAFLLIILAILRKNIGRA